MIGPMACIWPVQNDASAPAQRRYNASLAERSQGDGSCMSCACRGSSPAANHGALRPAGRCIVSSVSVRFWTADDDCWRLFEGESCVCVCVSVCVCICVHITSSDDDAEAEIQQRHALRPAITVQGRIEPSSSVWRVIL